MKNNVIVKLINKSNNPDPKRQSEDASGFDLRAFLDKPVTLEQNEIHLIPTGIYLEIPKGYEAQVRSRSGLASKHGLTLVNGIGTIDSDYRGEIKVIMMNLTPKAYTIHNGDRIAQLVFQPIIIPRIEVIDSIDDLGKSQRGHSGFGSSGIN